MALLAGGAANQAVAAPWHDQADVPGLENKHLALPHTALISLCVAAIFLM